MQRPRLGDVAREAVQDEPAGGIRAGQALADHAEHEASRPACRIHDRLGAQAQVGALGDRLTQQIAGRILRHAEGLDQQLPDLRALARARRTQ